VQFDGTVIEESGSLERFRNECLNGAATAPGAKGPPSVSVGRARQPKPVCGWVALGVADPFRHTPAGTPVRGRVYAYGAAFKAGIR
jgi:hypothetical protein